MLEWEPLKIIAFLGGNIYIYMGNLGKMGDRAREREKEKNQEGWVTTNNNHQSTLWGTPSLLLWKTWWWGILGHQTPGQGPSPQWRPPLPAGLQNPLLWACQQPLRTQEPRRCSGHTTVRLRRVSRDISGQPMELSSICGSNNRTPRTFITFSYSHLISF